MKEMTIHGNKPLEQTKSLSLRPVRKRRHVILALILARLVLTA